MQLTIDVLGAQGDGIVRSATGASFVPMALPGEVVKVSGNAPHFVLEEIITPSPDRVEPPCQHFVDCGGCSVQHLAAESYLEWKRAKVVEAFAAENLTPEIEPCVPCATGSRRRVTFTAQRVGTAIQLGFNARGGDELVSVDACSILHPDITNHLENFAQLCAVMVRGDEEIQLSISACENGLDLDFSLAQAPSETMMAGFVRAFAKTGFIRASVNGVSVVEREKPYVVFGVSQVNVPPGGFLQAVQSIEELMADLVCSHLKKSKKVTDLFCGSGTFALRLAKRARVHAVESEELALAALMSGSGADGLKPVTVEQRDLFEAPLTSKELARFDGVCLDPPRAGALDQIRELIRTDIPAIAYVSCNPQTLARDAALLIKNGYSLKRVVPLDQFLFSPHVEVVALFSKKIIRGNRPLFGRKV